MTDIDHTERPYAMLTKDDRRFLQAEGKGYNRKQRHDRKASITKRVTHSLIDFNLLCSGLPPDWRNEIFESEIEEPMPLLRSLGIESAIQFLYVGLGGESSFRNPLQNGVAQGEVKLGNATLPFQIEPTFYVESAETMRPDKPEELVNLVESGQWERLHATDLFAFLRLAIEARTIDFDEVRAAITDPEVVQKMRKDHVQLDINTEIYHDIIESQDDSIEDPD